MIRYLLDTNIVSDVIKKVPSASLLSWMQSQEDENLFISSITIAEIYKGILEKPAGRKRAELETWFASPVGPLSLFKGRVLAFDEAAALHWARLMAEGKRSRRSRDEVDTLIGAIALANDCAVVTNNERHFEGVRKINPMRQVEGEP